MQGAHDAAGDAAGAARGWPFFVGLAKPNSGVGTASPAMRELGVEAGGALHHPGVPVVVALEGGGLDPLLPVGRGDELRVAVGAHVREGDDAVGVAEALAADRVDDRQHVGVEMRQSGISWVTGSSPTYVVHSGLP